MLRSYVLPRPAPCCRCCSALAQALWAGHHADVGHGVCVDRCGKSDARRWASRPRPVHLPRGDWWAHVWSHTRCCARPSTDRAAIHHAHRHVQRTDAAKRIPVGGSPGASVALLQRLVLDARVTQRLFFLGHRPRRAGWKQRAAGHRNRRPACPAEGSPRHRAPSQVSVRGGSASARGNGGQVQQLLHCVAAGVRGVLPYACLPRYADDMAKSLFPLLEQAGVAVDRRVDMPDPPTGESLASLCSRVRGETEPSAGVIVASSAGCGAILGQMRAQCGHLFANGSAWVGADACASVPQGPAGFATVAPTAAATVEAVCDDCYTVPLAVARAIARPALDRPAPSAVDASCACAGIVSRRHRTDPPSLTAAPPPSPPALDATACSEHMSRAAPRFSALPQSLRCYRPARVRAAGCGGPVLGAPDQPAQRIRYGGEQQQTAPNEGAVSPKSRAIHIHTHTHRAAPRTYEVEQRLRARGNAARVASRPRNAVQALYVADGGDPAAGFACAAEPDGGGARCVCRGQHDHRTRRL